MAKQGLGACCDSWLGSSRTEESWCWCGRCCRTWHSLNPIPVGEMEHSRIEDKLVGNESAATGRRKDCVRAAVAGYSSWLRTAGNPPLQPRTT